MGITFVQDSMSASRARGVQEAVYYAYGSAVAGDLIEFGTMTGFTASAIATAMLAVENQYALEKRTLHLFDSFVGLPEPSAVPDISSPHVQLGHWAAGGCKVLNKEQLNALMSQILEPDRFSIVEGWYTETVPRIRPDAMFSFIHVDCDLYQSTIDALDPLFARGQIASGAVICFDDWMCNRASPAFGEQKAFIDLSEKYRALCSPWGFYTWSGARFIIHSYGPPK